MSELTGEERIRRVFRASIAIVGVILSVVIVLGLYISSQPAEQPSAVDELEVAGPLAKDEAPVKVPSLPFTDITRDAGLDFVHHTGASGERLLPETMGGGVAFFDYDRDGHQDLLLINSDHWPWQPEPVQSPTMHLYRGLGDGTFEDVTEEAGLDLSLYGMGVAVGDYDGDGLVDIFVTAVGENRLFKNVKGKRFADVTDTAGVAGSADAWSTSAAFLDYDRDGDLDLFVCNYVTWSRAIDREVDYRLTGIGRAYGPPTDFAGTDSWLYRNDGDGFTDVTEEAGIMVEHETSGEPVGKALAVIPVDVNGDGWLDLAVANDTVRNFLFVNQRDGGFKEEGMEYGLAFDTDGMATGAMGIDVVHLANEDRLGIAIGNFANEMSSFYVSSRWGSFSDNAMVAGMGAETRRALTFGLLFMDVDLDGKLDLLQANGHVEPEINRVQSSQHYAQPSQLFWNCGSACDQRYVPVKDNTADLATPRIGRGAAYADIDHDGDLDLVVTQVGGPAALLRNDQTLGHHFLRLSLRGNDPNRYAIGALVTLVTGGNVQRRTVMPARSYLSQVELPITFGLGNKNEVDRLIVRWPDGESEVWSELEIDRHHLLEQGAGDNVSSVDGLTVSGRCAYNC